MAYGKPTSITKVTFVTTKTGKTFTTSMGSTFATKYQGIGDKFTGKTIFPVTIDGQVFMVPVSISATIRVDAAKGDSVLVHVNQTDTIQFVSMEEVALEPKAAPAPKGISGAVVRPAAPAAVAPAATSKFRTL